MTGILDSERLAVLVHEVRSPIAALSAIAEALDDDDLDREGRQELVRLAALACRSVERIVGDAAVASIRAELIDSEALIRDVVAAATVRGVLVELTVRDELPAIDGDAPRLRQALDNLITNAVVHGSSHGVVSVRAEGGAEVRFFVSDSGAGIAPEELEPIFDVGVRLDPETPGAGLGLALARAVAEGHGGSLTVVSTPGKGSTFALTLPAAPRRL